jgi:hypothetical protein
MSRWEKAVTVVPLTERKCFNGMVIYTFWNLWKERNRRIFNNNYKISDQRPKTTLSKEGELSARGGLVF